MKEHKDWASPPQGPGMRKEERMKVAGSRRRGLRALLILIVVAMLPGAWLLQAANRSHADRGTNSRWMETWKETVGEIVLPLIMDERTRYAPAYREEAFRAVKRGASDRRRPTSCERRSVRSARECLRSGGSRVDRCERCLDRSVLQTQQQRVRRSYLGVRSMMKSFTASA